MSKGKGNDAIERNNDGSDELPEGWAVCTLDDVGRWATGGTPSRKVNSYFGGNIRWVKSGDLNDGIVRHTEETITEQGLNNSAAKLLPSGTLSVALYGATIGKLGILGMEAATNQACANCVVNEEHFSPWFVFYYLLAQRRFLVEAGQGGAQPNLTNAIVREWPLPFPPLAEQKRIVAEVEALLERGSKARERLSRVPDILRRFRQSVLAAACSGRLTADWRETNQQSPAVELFPEGVESDELPDSWRVVKFGEYVENHDGARIPIRSSDREKRRGDYPYYGASGIIDSIDGFTHEGEFVLIGEDGANLLSRSTPIAFIATGRFWVNNHAHVVRPRYGLPNYYLATFINSLDLEPFVTGSAQPKLTQRNMNAIEVPVPPAGEQTEIVRRAHALLGAAERIEKLLGAALTRVTALTHSVLAKAFTGELVETEADIARREGREYESGDELLARVRLRGVVSPIRRSRTTEAVQVRHKPTRYLGATMGALDRAQVIDAIAALKKESFTFADLRAQLSEDYDAIRDTLFALLDESDSPLKQIFDDSGKEMSFVWRDK